MDSWHKKTNYERFLSNKQYAPGSILRVLYRSSYSSSLNNQNKYMGYKNGYYYWVGLPTGVQYYYQDTTLTNNYKKLEQYEVQVRNSFKLK